MSDCEGETDHDSCSNGHAVVEEVRIIEASVEASQPNKPTWRGGSEPLHEHPKDIAFPDTIAIPTHHIRLGDFVLLEHRPCQVVKISTSAVTGQYRYLGVDLFTKRLYEETASIYNVGPNVVQTMLAPVFRRYRVLGIENDGHVLALTDKGRMKERLPVIDQSGLWGRINAAFEAQRGSVYVAVLEADGIGLAVDVKVVHGAQVDGEAQFVELPVLHELARNGDLRGLHIALVKGENINSQDNNGRTAIFHAIQNRQHDFIAELVKQGIDIGRTDNEGKTAFDYIMEVVKDDPATYPVAEDFLERKPSLTQSIGFPIPNLLSLSATGDLTKIEETLANFGESQAVEVNKTDKLGYTPLHEAACFGRHDVVEKLIQFGSNVNAEVTLGGDTVLHAVIERRNHRRFLGESRSLPPSLSTHHIKVVEILLRHHAESNRRRYSDNMTVQDLLFDKLKSEGLREAERSILERILMIIKGRPINELQLAFTGPRSIPATDPFDQFISLKIQHHPFGFEASPDSEQMLVDEFLQKPTPIARGKKWRWIHLSKNNKIWVEKVVSALQAAEAGSSSMYSEGIREFINQAYDEIQCAAHHPGMRRPSFNPLHESYPTIFSLVMPYFDSESLECMQPSGCANAMCQSHRRKDTAWRNNSIKITPGSIKDLHEACTLDQSCYVSLREEDYVRRNKDQVVAKHARAGEGGRILMVKQMWIWRTSYDTIITAFPERLHDHGLPTTSKTLFGYLDESFRRNPPRSIDSMVARMMQCAIDFANGPPYAAFQEDILDIFQRSIAQQADKEAACYENFQSVHTRLRMSRFNLRRNMEAEIAALCEIQNELDSLLEIKDIAVELRMIQRVLRDQQTVGIDCMRRYTFSSTEQQDLDASLRGVEARMLKVEKLLDDAGVVENSLKSLLDMKQRHGNLNMVRDTRKRALDSDWQTQLLFIFTIVTVIFTPISYVCGFLAVPSKDFPDDGENGVSWAWGQILSATVVTEGVVAIPILVYWWWYKTKMVKKPVDLKGLNEKEASQPEEPAHGSIPIQGETRSHSNV